MPHLQELESRTVLSTTALPNLYWFYTRRDVIETPRASKQVALPLTGDRLTTTPWGRSLIEVRVSPTAGSNFVPGAMQLIAPNGNPIDIQVLRRGTDLVCQVSLEKGNYSVKVWGRGASRGAFLVRTHLVGDANGDRMVDNADVRDFVRGAGRRDVNRDGFVNTRDLRLMQLNSGSKITTVPVRVTNNTGLTGQQGQIYFTVYGADLGFDGTSQLDQWYLDGTQAKTVISPSSSGALPSFSLANYPNGIEIPLPNPKATSNPSPILNGRIYIGVGSPVIANITSGTVAAPTPGDGLNDQTFYDFSEFALQFGSVNNNGFLFNLNMDTSQVDQFGLNLQLSMADLKGGTQGPVGIIPKLSRDGLIQRYQNDGPIQANYLPATVFSANGNTYRLLNPSDAITLSLRNIVVAGVTLSNVQTSGNGTTATATFPNGSNTQNLFAGMSVTGTGIPAGTTIQSLTGPNTLTLVSTGQLTATSADLTFAGQPTNLLHYFDTAITDAFNYYTPTAQGGGGHTLTLAAVSNNALTNFTGTVNTNYKITGSAMVDYQNESQYISIVTLQYLSTVTLTTGDTTQLQPGYQVLSNGSVVGTIVSIGSSSQFTIASSNPIAAATGTTLTFTGTGAPAGSDTGNIPASASPTAQLQPNYTVDSNGTTIGTISSILSATQIAVISSTQLSAASSVSLTFSGAAAPTSAFPGSIAAGTPANQMATFTYSKVVSGNLDNMVPGMVVTGAGVYTPATTVYAIDEANKTITLYSPLPITASAAQETLIFTTATGTQVQLQGLIGNVQQLYAYQATVAEGENTTGLYQGMTVSGGNFPAGTFISSVSTASTTVLNLLSTGNIANGNDVPLTFTWTDSQGNEQVYTVFQFTGDGSSYEIFLPFFSTNGGGATAPVPPPWLANTTETGSNMVFACNGVFADNVGQYPSDGNASTVLGALENQVVSALNRGVATTLVTREGEITQNNISPDGKSATLTITDPQGTAGLVPGMTVSGPGSPVGLVIAPNGITANSVRVVSTEKIQAFNTELLTFSQPYAQGGTWNAYSAFFHQRTVTIDGKAYGFAFDDQGGKSTDISIDNPAYAQLVLGPWAKSPPR